MARKGLAAEAAKKYLEELDRIRARRMRELFNVDWRDPTRYDLVLNTAKTMVETAVQESSIGWLDSSGRSPPEKLFQCYGENLPPAIADSVREPRSLWIILLSDSRFDIDGVFANCERIANASPSPTHNKRRIMFPCPLHSGLDRESQAEVIRRSKLAQSWGLEVKWIEHEVFESMIIINPPTRDNGDLDDGIAFVDLSLPHLDSAARAKFEITQTEQAKIFSDLV